MQVLIYSRKSSRKSSPAVLFASCPAQLVPPRDRKTTPGGKKVKSKLIKTQVYHRSSFDITHLGRYAFQTTYIPGAKHHPRGDPTHTKVTQVYRHVWAAHVQHGARPYHPTGVEPLHTGDPSPRAERRSRCGLEEATCDNTVCWHVSSRARDHGRFVFLPLANRSCQTPTPPQAPGEALEEPAPTTRATPTTVASPAPATVSVTPAQPTESQAPISAAPGHPAQRPLAKAAAGPPGAAAPTLSPSLPSCYSPPAAGVVVPHGLNITHCLPVTLHRYHP